MDASDFGLFVSSLYLHPYERVTRVTFEPVGWLRVNLDLTHAAVITVIITTILAGLRSDMRSKNR